MTKDQRDTFIQVLGIPLERMMVIENSNKATSLAADLTMQKDVIAPRAEFQRSYFQEKLMPEYDDRLVLDFILPTVGDSETKLKATQAPPRPCAFPNGASSKDSRPSVGKGTSTWCRPSEAARWHHSTSWTNPRVEMVLSGDVSRLASGSTT